VPATQCLALAATVPKALRLARRLHPDLAVFDIRLAGPEDGMAGADLLRRSIGLPIIFLTGEIDPGVRKRAAAFLFAAVLIKPVPVQTVIKVIESMVEDHADQSPSLTRCVTLRG